MKGERGREWERDRTKAGVKETKVREEKKRKNPACGDGDREKTVFAGVAFDSAPTCSTAR